MDVSHVPLMIAKMRQTVCWVPLWMYAIAVQSVSELAVSAIKFFLHFTKFCVQLQFSGIPLLLNRPTKLNNWLKFYAYQPVREKSEINTDRLGRAHHRFPCSASAERVFFEKVSCLGVLSSWIKFNRRLPMQSS